MKYYKCINIIMAITGIVCTSYYAYLVITYGSISFAWTFMVIGLFLLLTALWEYTHQKHLLSYMHKHIQKLCIVILCAVSFCFVYVETDILIEGHKKAEPHDTIIVLGAQLNGNKISRSLRYRLDTAVEIAHAYPHTTFIVSGGKGAGESVSEALAMKTYMIAHGVDETRIIMEDASTNTQENFIYSFNLIKDNRPVSIITNSFHIKRAKLICSRLDRSCNGIGAKTDADLAFVFYFREFFAYIKDAVTL